jgi:hypothetical protein
VGEKKRVAQKKHQEEKWLGVTDLERWVETWCDELKQYGESFEEPNCFEGAYDCSITYELTTTE